MGNESAEYLSLANPPTWEGNSVQCECRATTHARALREKLLVIIVLLQAVALLAFVFIRAHDGQASITCQCPSDDTPLLYCESCQTDPCHLLMVSAAPAQVALEHEVKAFTAGREHKTIYQGLSDEVDRAWGELYNRKL